MKTKAKITFGLVDVTAKADSNPNIEDRQEFVNLNDLKREDLEETKYGTLEKNQFALDGTFQLMPYQLQDMGLWSESMTNENGLFDNSPVLEINFSETHSSLGLTFLFSEANDYCNHLNIKYYDSDNNVISDIDFRPDNYLYVCNNIVEHYNKIVITFYSTNNPFRYLKLYKILYGAEKVFEGDNLMKADILEELDLLSSEISINTLNFTVYSADDEFNIINPKGFYKLLQERQKLQVSENIVKENKEIDMGTFYLDTWANEKDKTMKIGAIDLIGVIDKTDFLGGIYTNIGFETLIQLIMESAGLTQDDYEIQDELKSIVLSGYIPICSHRKALQQAVFAVGGIADCSRSSKIKIYTITNEDITGNIEITRKFQGTTKIEQNELVTGVEVVAHSYTKSTEQEKLFEGILSPGTSKILFNDPVYGLTASGGTIIESNCNYAIIQCTNESNVLINGYKYEDNLQTYLIEIEDLSNAKKQNTLKIESAYLINKNNANTIARKVLDYYQKTYKASLDIILQNERVSDNFSIESEFEQQLVGHITKLDIDLTGGFLAGIELNAKVKENE